MDNGSSSNGMEGAGIGGLFLGILIGAVAGGVAALLYAPQSGPQTRQQFRDEVIETQKMLQRWSDDVKERAERFSQIVRFRTESELHPSGNGQEKVGQI